MTTDPEVPQAEEGEEEPANTAPPNAAADALAVQDDERLVRLKKRLDVLSHRAQAMSRTLPRAFALSSEKGDGLAEAMTATVERAVAISARKNRSVLAKALAPVIGSAICRGLIEGIAHGVAVFNRFFLHHLSAESVKWRIEAQRTGRPFREVLHQYTQYCPVKQVFLIHRETGLLLQQVQNDVVPYPDGDMVSGMLTAIQDFVHDSFGGNQTDRLETIQVGDLTVWIEQGPLAVLAGIMYGKAPPELRTAFQNTLAKIHSDFSDELDGFDGDTSVFSETRPHLQKFLEDTQGRRRERVSPIAALIALVLVVILCSWGYRRAGAALRWRGYLKRLRSEPGIVVLESGRRSGRFHVAGLRDPLARSPVFLLAQAGFDPAAVESAWDSYQALAPEIILARARVLLQPPETVNLAVVGNSVQAVGSATEAWARRAHDLVQHLPGVTALKTDGLVLTDAEQNRNWQAYLEELDKQPGIIIMESGKANGRFHVSGLRDPMAADPIAMLVDFGLQAWVVESQWEPYQALHSQLAFARAERLLDPPQTVALALEDGVLFARGNAPHPWVVRARALSRGLVGVAHFDTAELVDEGLRELEEIRQRIESRTFRFLVGSPDLWPGQQQKLAALVRDVRELISKGRKASAEFIIEIRGHTNASGNERREESDSLLIARRLFETLQSQNLDMRVFLPVGMGSNRPTMDESDTEPPTARLASFRVVFLED